MIRQNQTDGRIFGTRLDASFVSCRQRGTTWTTGASFDRSTVRPFVRSFVRLPRGSFVRALGWVFERRWRFDSIRFDSIRFDSSVGLIQLLQLINFRQRVSRSVQCIVRTSRRWIGEPGRRVWGYRRSII